MTHADDSPTSTAHYTDHYGRRPVPACVLCLPDALARQRAATLGGHAAAHTRLHVTRGIKSPTCSLCQGEPIPAVSRARVIAAGRCNPPAVPNPLGGVVLNFPTAHLSGARVS